MSGDDASMRVRPMAAGDLDRVQEIAAGLAQAPQWRRSAYEAALDPTKVHRVAMVAEDAGTSRIEGFVIARLTPPEAELESIAVAAGLQRMGVGRRLLQELVRDAGALGMSSIALEVRASNQAARGFYEALSFTEVGRRRSYYADPIEDAVLMERREPVAESP
ncbi:MAG: ribosomal protein S18-alanine N-acetyltransferase [Terracidiphilus sp.]